MRNRSRHIAITALVFLLAGLTSQVYAQVYPVKVNKQWGLIDSNGTQTVPAQYDAITDIGPEHATIVQKGRYGLIDHQGKLLVNSDFAFVAEKEPGIVWINQAGGEDNPGSKWGLINLVRNRRLEPTFDLIETFVGEWARVNQGGECDYDTCRGGRWGIIDKNAKEIAPVIYSDIQLSQAGEAFVRNDSGWGRLGEDGKRTIPNMYRSLSRYRPDMLFAQRGDTFSMIDDHNQVRIPPLYTGLRGAGQGFIAYRLGKKWGMMDTSGNRIIPAKYDDIQVLKHNWVKVKEDRKWGLQSVTGKRIFNPVLNAVGEPQANFIPAMRDRRWGVVNTQGEILIPFKLDEVELMGDTLIRVRQNNNYRWYSREGKPLRKAYYDEMIPFTKGDVVTKFKHHGRWGVINSQGRILARPKYSDIRLIHSTAKMKNSAEEWEFVYFDELGNRSKVRRLVIIKDDVSSEELFRPSRGEKGWFLASATNKWGLMKEGTSNVLIKPRFTTAMLIPGTDLTVVQAPSMGGIDKFGIVDHNKGKEVIEPIFQRIFAEDFIDFPVARAKFNNVQGYALIDQNGSLITYPNLTYIGKFVEGRARACVGGSLIWNDSVSIDTLDTRLQVDRFTQETKKIYLHAKGGKWGFIDTEGNWEKEATYEGALDFANGACRVKLNQKWGMVNEDWQIIIQPQFDYIEFMEMPSGERLLLTGMATPAIGFIDTLGDLAIQPQFFDAGDFQEGLVRVREGNLWGFADRQGNMVIQPQFKQAEDFSGGLARIALKRGWDFIGRDGSRLTGKSFLRANDYKDGVSCVQEGEFFGYLDPAGQFTIEPKFSKAGDFSQGLAPAWRKGACGLINKKGKYVIPPKYYRVWPFQDSVARIQMGGDMGLINPAGDFVLKPSYREIEPFVNGLAKVRQGNTYGYIKPNGEVYIELQYPNAGNFSEGRAPVFQKGKWGFIDTTGTLIIPAIYSSVEVFQGGRAAVQDEGRWGFIDLEGAVVIPLIYDQVRPFNNERAAVYLSDKGWGFVNTTGVQVIAPEYEKVLNYVNGIARVKNKGKWGLVNEYGGAVTLLKYDAIGEYKEGLAKVLLVRKNGVLAEDGKEYLPPNFDTIKRIGDLIQVEVSDRIGYIDTEGDWVWNLTK